MDENLKFIALGNFQACGQINEMIKKGLEAENLRSFDDLTRMLMALLQTHLILYKKQKAAGADAKTTLIGFGNAQRCFQLLQYAERMQNKTIEDFKPYLAFQTAETRGFYQLLELAEASSNN